MFGGSVPVSAHVAARRLLRLDALFEVALGGPLLALGMTGRHELLRLPPPASDGRLAAFGGGLLPFAGLLVLASRRPAKRFLQALAVGNATTSLLFTGWLVAGRRETGARGAVVLGATAGLLLALAAGQARVSPRLA